MRIGGRLARLERAVGTGCPECRHRRGHSLLQVGRQEPDGTVRSATEAPRPCARCGQVPEEVIEVVEVIIHSREERERLPPEQRCQTSETNS
jgi:hypothetical protein